MTECMIGYMMRRSQRCRKEYGSGGACPADESDPTGNFQMGVGGQISGSDNGKKADCFLRGIVG